MCERPVKGDVMKKLLLLLIILMCADTVSFAAPKSLGTGTFIPMSETGVYKGTIAEFSSKGGRTVIVVMDKNGFRNAFEVAQLYTLIVGKDGKNATISALAVTAEVLIVYRGNKNGKKIAKSIKILE